MFDFVQKNRRVVQVILALLAIPFAIWGIESYTRVSGGRDMVAKVNGLEITRRELDEQMAQQLERVREAFGAQIDPAALDTPEARRALLDGMIAQRLVTSEAARRHLFMSKAAVIDAISNAPEFQENGRFSEPRFNNYLASRNTTPERYVAELQTQLPLARLVTSVADAAITPRSVASGRGTVWAMSSSLRTTVPSPGKCFSVAATPPAWSPRRNAVPIADTRRGSDE